MASLPQCQSERRQRQTPLQQSPATRLRSQAQAVASENSANPRAEALHGSPFLRAIYSWDEIDELQRDCASYTRQLAEIPISFGTHTVVSSTAHGLSAALADPASHVKP